MNQNHSPSDRFAVNLAQFAIRWRWWVLLAALILTATIGASARHLEFANNYRTFFSEENPELTAFEELQTTYTKNDNFLFVLVPGKDNVFSVDTLSAVEDLTAGAWKIPHAIRVDSITNFQHSYAIGDELVVEDLIRDAASLDAASRDARARIALDEPLLLGQLVTPDRRATAVNVVLQYPEQSLNEVPDAVTAARTLRAQIKSEHPDMEVYLTGVSMLNNDFMEAGMSDMGTLVPAMFAFILILTLFVLRSVGATVATAVVIMLSTMVAMGAAGLMGVKLTPISGSAPIVILTLAIADSIHILISLRKVVGEGRGRVEAITEALRLNFMPVSITSLTTIIGFLALNFSDSPPFWHLGNITAIGIGAAWLFSITILPALMSMFPIRAASATTRSRRLPSMNDLASFVIARPRTLLLTLGVASTLLISFVPSLQLNDQWTRYFDQRIEFRGDTDQGLQHFGMYPIEFSVPAKGPGAVSEPEYLKHLADFTEFLRQQPEVTHVYSISDIMKRLNKNMHGDDPEYDRLPQERDLSAQYLLLYELSLPYGLDLNDRINIDKSATRVTATLGDVDSIATKRVLGVAQDWLDRNAPSYMQTKPTSAQVMFTYIADRNVQNMVGGTIGAVLVIAVIMMFALRSISLGLLSLVPNGLPILATFGAWALLVGEVGFSVATVASISLGVIVDDTVHFLSKYVRARKENGLSTEDSIRYAFNSVGVAILVNTLVLAAGFLVLIFSSFKINADMGLLTALAITLALILDFLFLPAILLVLDRTSKVINTEGEINMRTTKIRKAISGSPATTVLALATMLGTLSLLNTTPASAASAITPVRGETPAEKLGFEIAALSDRSDRGFGDSAVELKMILRNAAGKESIRSLSIATLEVADETVGDKTLVKFETPRDIEGTALLSHARILDPDDQWLFLPALKRTKRISSANKSGPFVGSEFAFEDFTSLELNKYEYRWLREEACGGLVCNVVERTPRYEYSGYTRQLAWIDSEFNQIRKLEFYDRRGDLLKTLELSDYRDYGGIWRAHQLLMVNHQTGKSTDLIYSDYRFAVGLTDNDLAKGRLSRLR